MIKEKEMKRMSNFWIKRALRGVGIKKDVLVKYVASLDADENGIIELEEVAVALKYLWLKARGKVKDPKQIVIGD